MLLDHDVAYRAVQTRDTRFDGQFVTAVSTTGIYCRPACPARTPHRSNVTFLPTAAAAQAAGYRACKRCLPDAAPGSPEWNLRADTVGAAMRLISDGVVDREGVPGLASRLGYSPRQVTRLLTGELGAGPLALARAHRARTARILLTSTALPVTDVAFAAGFASVRQFNETIRDVFDTSPSRLRQRFSRSGVATDGPLTLKLRVRPPFDGAALLAFLADRAVTGVEVVTDRTYARTLDLPGGPGVVLLELPTVAEPPQVRLELRLSRLTDLTPAVDRCRRLLDADADPAAVDDLLAADPALTESVRQRPGLRVPGAVDGPEILVRAIAGQQVSVASARTWLGRLTELTGRPLPAELAAPGLTHLFPRPEDLAALDPAALTGPRRRSQSLVTAAVAIATGELRIDAGRDSADLHRELQLLPGIGPWTAGYVAMRVLGDPDVLLTGDLVLRHGAERLGLPTDPASLTAHAQRWRPFRSYAAMHLWQAGATTRTRTAQEPPQ